MPYLGAPFIEEGGVEGLLAGDRPGGRLAASAAAAWARTTHAAVRLDRHARRSARATWPGCATRSDAGIAAGQTRVALQQANLVPPTLAQSPSAVHLAYLVLRENLINRLFDQGSGYWQNGLQGLDALSDAEHGAALVDYLGLDESRILDATERMVADGRHELAAATAALGAGTSAGQPAFVPSARTRLPQTDGEVPGVQPVQVHPLRGADRAGDGTDAVWIGRTFFTGVGLGCRCGTAGRVSHRFGHWHLRT